jgi:Putative Flp pilus-assembly TadE/G-like
MNPANVKSEPKIEPKIESQDERGNSLTDRSTFSNCATPPTYMTGMREGGYVAIVTALLISLLLICVGLVVDLAVWYSRSSTLQRSADAAALAGVTAAPILTNEIALATESLAKNGIVNGVNGVSVNIENLPGYANRLRVTVTDTQVPGFFTKFFRSSPSLIRTASAQYLQNISLGSALNAIGTGNLPGMTPAGGTQDFWLSVSGYCTAKEDGDRLLAYADGSRKRASFEYACNESSVPHPDLGNAHVNTDYDPAGYTYFLSIPCPGANVGPVCPVTEITTKPIVVKVYDPSYSPNVGTDPLDTRIDRKAVANSQHWAWTQSEVTTTFQVFRPDDTPEQLGDDIAVAPSEVFRTCQAPCATTNQWYDLVTIPAGSRKGRYRIQVHTEREESTGYGHNMFALYAATDNVMSLCSTIPGNPASNPDCPSVAGDESMSVYANKAGASADMYLAQLAPASEYRGKRIRVLLWDPGEGADSIQIVSPVTGAPVTFRYRTWNPGQKWVSGPKAGQAVKDRGIGWSTRLTSNSLDVSGTVNPFGTYPEWDRNSRYSASKYNDRMVAVEFTVPKSYGKDALGNPAPLPENGWWKIRYNTSTGNVTDRTTWSVTLAGDPVHLVDKTETVP